ncbi:DUF6501 family protein [Clostridium botulinum]|uniref:DUF6501 family protein n=1 Tax=Clostridium botulinum TaxID=1491 RepID=UPI001C9B68BB|nr:DUF6501 family protein [Clostridium botulinum]MBY6838650.1 hypothetical protein [Clostridium botulinum]
MKVKCIQNNNISYEKLTIGEEYQVKKESEGTYLILDDNGYFNWFYKSQFEIVKNEEGLIKFEDIVRSPIKGIELNCSDEEWFKNNYIKNDADRTIYIRSNTQSIAKVKPSEIPQLIEWLQKINTYIGQVKNKTKEMTMEEIEKELGYKIKIVGVER